ncbi:MAG: hypothetical protein FWK04_12605 [Nostoc sp. GBBB01]|nr:hypothetical protein [Nostoc sp. GBBB01]
MMQFSGGWSPRTAAIFIAQYPTPNTQCPIPNDQRSLPINPPPGGLHKNSNPLHLRQPRRNPSRPANRRTP